MNALKVWSAISDYGLRLLARDRLSKLEQWPDVSRVFCVCNLLCYPEPGLIIHHCVEVLHVPLDLEE
jgi:hypothetical protein